MIPKRITARVIGKGAATLKKLEEQSGASMSMERRQANIPSGMDEDEEEIR